MVLPHQFSNVKGVKLVTFLLVNDTDHRLSIAIIVTKYLSNLLQDIEVKELDREGMGHMDFQFGIIMIFGNLKTENAQFVI